MRALAIKLALPLLLLSGLVNANAYYRAHPLHLEEPARSDFVSASLRDNDGFLWIGTDNGLKRYDGYSLRVFRHSLSDPASIGSNANNTLLLTRSGELWFGGNLLSHYHREQENFSSYNPSSFRSIRVMHEDPAGKIWLAGDGFGLLRFNPHNGRVEQTHFADSPEGEINALVESPDDGVFWIASRAGLYAFQPESGEKTVYTLPMAFAEGGKYIRDLSRDRQGLLWLSSDTGLGRFNPASGEFRQYLSQPNRAGSLSTNNLWALRHDHEGKLWVGTDKQGLHRYQPETDTFEHYRASNATANSLPRSPLVNIHQDAQNNLWLAMGAAGVYRINHSLEKFRIYQHSAELPDSLSLNSVLDFLEDRQGRIWLSTDGGGLNLFDPQTQRFRHFRHRPGDKTSLSSDSILSLAMDAQGFIWCGTWGGGLNKLDPASGRVTRFQHDASAPVNQTLSSNNIFRIENTGDGRLLLSTWGQGFQILDPQSHRFETFLPSNADNDQSPHNFNINDFHVVDDDEIWIAGYNGLEKFSLREKRFTRPLFPFEGAVFDIERTDNNSLWLATSQQLVEYKPASGSSELFKQEQGLIDNFVVSLIKDNSGNLWAGTRNGLSKLNLRDKSFTNFTEKDGLPGVLFNRGSHLVSRSGELFLGTTKGLVVFKPAQIPVNEHAPNVVFTGLELFQQAVVPGRNAYLPKPLNFTQQLVLPYSQRDITFKFSALNLVVPEKNRFRFRLQGLETDWLEADSSNRRVRYTNLDAGNYQFQLLSANGDGVWNASAKTIDIKILPVWWRTWWALLGYILLSVVLIFGFIHWRLRANQSRNKELQHLVEKQTTQLRLANTRISKLNSELEQRVAHRTQELENEIQERRESEKRANFLAYHDSLTGLKNRTWLLQHLKTLVEQKQSHYAVFYMGGDRFRKINDIHGYVIGDKLLIAVAQRLASDLPQQAQAVRLGSDEFVVILDRTDNQKQVSELAETLLERFNDKFELEHLKIQFGVSLGVLMDRGNYSEATKVLRNASIAMQAAKDQGRGVWRFFDKDMVNSMLENTRLETDLRRALGRSQLSVVYQPIVEMETQRLYSFELLLRWNHPEHGMVPPDKFIGIAESIGLIFEIGLWVLKQACLQINLWRREFGLQDTPNVSVNLSALQLGQSDLLQKIDEVFTETGAPRDKIRFEITESALMENSGMADQLMEGLRKRGIELAIDDFGTGYSSLSYLDRLPVQSLKIDRSFVNGLLDQNHHGDSAQEIIRATISLAHNLKMRVVAEGIETKQQMEMLEDFLCDYGQGYFIAKPLSAQDAGDFIRKAINVRAYTGG